MGGKGARHGKVTVGGKAAARNVGDGRQSRAAELAEAVRDAPRPPRSRKDTRRWCKGKVGREHTPAIVYSPWYGRECQAAQRWQLALWKQGWVCQHREECSACGKVLRQGWKLAPEECPQRPGEGA